MSAPLSKLAALVVESVLPEVGKRLLDFSQEKKDDMALSTFESLEGRVRQLSAITCDVAEKFKQDEQRGHKKRKRQVEEWLEQVQNVFNEFLTLEKEIQTKAYVERFFSGGRVTKLDGKVQNLIEQRQQFGEQLVVDVYDNKGDILLTNGLVGDEFENNLESIMKFLDEDVLSIGIYGMGGVGKTTLAKHINNRLLQRKKKSVCWITVSQEFTITMLQDKIAKFISLDLSSETDEDKRAASLKKVLSEIKNIIFIFDDMWEGIDMKKLGDPLSVDGSKLLITTRSKNVCDKLDCEKIIKVEILNESEAWKLFNQTLGIMILTPEVQEIAKSMVKECDGLPLGIITIAGSMKGQTNLHVWEDAWNELCACVLEHSDMDEKVFKVLKYSFDRLERSKEKDNGHSRAQNCFLYCSLYPEDYRIERDDLIRKWILEEYLEKRSPKVVSGQMHYTPSRKDLFSQGKAMLDRLIKVCLLENVGADHVKMHDLVRDMAHKIYEGKTKVKVICGYSSLEKIPNEQEWGEDLEKMSLMENCISKIPTGMSPNCPRLSTLLFSGNPLGSIPLSFFSRMCCLCILDLSHTSIRRIPRSLSNLDGLKALLLGGCRSLETVPNLGKLKKLRELDLSGTAVGEVPIKGAEIFNDLTYLVLDKCKKLKKLPKGLQRIFPNLQCLYLPSHKDLPSDIEAPVQEIEQLEHLEVLSGAVRDVSKFNSLTGLWPESLSYCIEIRGSGCTQMQIWKGLGPYKIRLEIVEVVGFGFRSSDKRRKMKFSEFDFGSLKETLNAQDVQYLYLQGCKWRQRNGLVDVLALLNNPTSIECLKLHCCNELESGYMNEEISNGDAVTSTSAYPPPPPSCALFSNITVLVISQCGKMKKLGIPASQLQNLEELDIRYCSMLEEIMDAVSEENGGGESGEASVVSLTKLKILRLRNLPRLKSLCNALIICSSIEEIELRSCLELKKVPLVFGDPNYDSPPSLLKSVWLSGDESEREWWEKLEMGHDTPTIRPMLERVVRWL